MTLWFWDREGSLPVEKVTNAGTSLIASEISIAARTRNSAVRSVVRKADSLRQMRSVRSVKTTLIVWLTCCVVRSLIIRGWAYAQHLTTANARRSTYTPQLSMALTPKRMAEAKPRRTKKMSRIRTKIINYRNRILINLKKPQMIKMWKTTDQLLTRFLQLMANTVAAIRMVLTIQISWRALVVQMIGSRYFRWLPSQSLS